MEANLFHHLIKLHKENEYVTTIQHEYPSEEPLMSSYAPVINKTKRTLKKQEKEKERITNKENEKKESEDCDSRPYNL
jgi:hypothetical protein